MLEKCLVWLVILGALFLVWLSSRKKFNQILLVIGLSFAFGVLIRLIRLRTDTQALWTIGYFLGGLALLYGVTWIGARWLASDDDSRPRPRRRQRK